MQDSILVISARSPARVPVFPQLAYSLPGQKKQQLKTRGCIPPSNKNQRAELQSTKYE